MLQPEYLFHVADKVVELWEQLNLFAVKDICRRIADAGKHMTASAEWQIYKMEQSGMAADDIRRGVKRILGLSDREVKQIFEEAAVKSHNNDADVYAKAGVKSSPFGTKQAQKSMQVYYEQTNGEFRNFTRTMAVQTQQEFINACDEAFLSVQSGLQSREQAIRTAIDKAAVNGLYIYYPSGHRDTLEAAVRRAVTTGVNRAAIQLCIDECDREGTNFIRITAHTGARVSEDDPIANHAGWQGKTYRIWPNKPDFWGELADFALDGNERNYPLLEEATGYPSNPLGFGGYNCRHSGRPAIPGIIPDRVPDIDPEENKEKYERSQQQRAMEREMRKLKRKIEGEKAAAEVLDDPVLDDQIRIHEADYQRRLNQYYDFCDKHGLTRQTERLYTGGNSLSYSSKVHDSEIHRTRRGKAGIAEKKAFLDITSDVMASATPDSHRVEDMIEYVSNNVTYRLDGKHVVLKYSAKEMRIAELLQHKIGGKIHMVPKVNNPPSISTPDYIFRARKYDLKEISTAGKNVLYNALSKKKRQAHSFILDISGNPLSDTEIKRQIADLYRSQHMRFLDEIILIRDNQILGIYKRAKK